MILNHFNPSVFECFAAKDLQNWLNLQIEVKETFLDFIKLDSLIIAFLIWDVNSRWWLIDEVITGYRAFIYHVVFIFQRLPVVVSRWCTILLWTQLLGTVVASFLGCYLLLLHNLLLHSLLFQLCKTVSVCHLFDSGFLGGNRIRLHVYRVMTGVTQSLINTLIVELLTDWNN